MVEAKGAALKAQGLATSLIWGCSHDDNNLWLIKPRTDRNKISFHAHITVVLKLNPGNGGGRITPSPPQLLWPEPPLAIYQLVRFVSLFVYIHFELIKIIIYRFHEKNCHVRELYRRT